MYQYQGQPPSFQMASPMPPCDTMMSCSRSEPVIMTTQTMLTAAGIS